jgi:hypothetical protein
MPVSDKKQIVAIDTSSSNKYCKPFYLDGNRYHCIRTSLESDNDMERCIYTPNKISNIDLDPFCQNNTDYKSKFPQLLI